MKEFEFYQMIKMTVWETRDFIIEAESEEEAIAKAKEYRNKRINDDEERIHPGNFDVLWECSEDMMPDENDGNATIIVRDTLNNTISKNGK